MAPAPPWNPTERTISCAHPPVQQRSSHASLRQGQRCAASAPFPDPGAEPLPAAQHSHWRDRPPPPLPPAPPAAVPPGLSVGGPSTDGQHWQEVPPAMPSALPEGSPPPAPPGPPPKGPVASSPPVGEGAAPQAEHGAGAGGAARGPSVRKLVAAALESLAGAEAVLVEHALTALVGAAAAPLAVTVQQLSGAMEEAARGQGRTAALEACQEFVDAAHHLDDLLQVRAAPRPGGRSWVLPPVDGPSPHMLHGHVTAHTRPFVGLFYLAALCLLSQPPSPPSPPPRLTIDSHLVRGRRSVTLCCCKPVPGVFLIQSLQV